MSQLQPRCFLSVVILVLLSLTTASFSFASEEFSVRSTQDVCTSVLTPVSDSVPAGQTKLISGPYRSAVCPSGKYVSKYTVIVKSTDGSLFNTIVKDVNSNTFTQVSEDSITCLNRELANTFQYISQFYLSVKCNNQLFACPIEFFENAECTDITTELRVSAVEKSGSYDVLVGMFYGGSLMTSANGTVAFSIEGVDANNKNEYIAFNAGTSSSLSGGTASFNGVFPLGPVGNFRFVAKKDNLIGFSANFTKVVPAKDYASSWIGTYKIKSECDQAKCCCPTPNVVITRIDNNSIKIKASTAAGQCTNSQLDYTLYSPQYSGILSEDYFACPYGSAALNFTTSTLRFGSSCSYTFDKISAATSTPPAAASSRAVGNSKKANTGYSVNSSTVNMWVIMAVIVQIALMACM
ncbi:hypothetical protein C9374_005334 [Naegleria lovaniensis]|uniref:Uncharacterized protein n=1 Tax=Naegleria lovaniensis TaxID=51637 RepID=A0AA88GKS3_NAELO|nr:uncharacterized protein C9374_005334 [Naegleria lovaniensis]KAG2382754.1 hypothetical protein C9374_005334 [Naegleria lovaniensis]